MNIDYFLNLFEESKDTEAVIWNDRHFTYEWLIKKIEEDRRYLEKANFGRGQVVFLEADFSPGTIALLLALIERDTIIIPSVFSNETMRRHLLDVSQAGIIAKIDSRDNAHLEHTHRQAQSPLYETLRATENPGLVLFSSGSAGQPKAAVHNFSLILEKFKIKRHSRRAIAFLLFDHIGGINTLFYTLSNKGCLITVSQRTPDNVLEAIEKYQADMLPTSPTFLNMVLLSLAHERHNLSCLKLITYGTEPMPEILLKKLHEAFPRVTLQQTYGLSEIGILRSKSKGSDSLWVKVGGEGIQTRIVDGILQVKAQSTMVGYLNAPSPITEDGWFITGDRVEQEGEYIRILGRDSDMINVGGQKVNPVEVEGVIQGFPNTSEVTVYKEPNFITGSTVCAKITTRDPVENQKQFIMDIKKYCRKYLENYKIPIKIEIITHKHHSQRFKKDRKLVHEHDD